jgi:hypothetical protein
VIKLIRPEALVLLVGKFFEEDRRKLQNESSGGLICLNNYSAEIQSVW